MRTKTLAVYLKDSYVGMLTMLLDGRTILAFDERYLNNKSRPTLSLSFKNVLNQPLAQDVVSPSGKLSPFFSHLLPEGKLRTYLARKANVRETQESPLLMALSNDLPGAVVLRLHEPHSPQLPPFDDEEFNDPEVDGAMRFSLAGVQLKFSGNLENTKMVIPARGIGGHWIVKLPSPMYPHVNELEYSMMQLASEIGITVPEFRMMPLSELENLPKDLPESVQGNCFISQRFDRTAGGGRIHMEDFAQIFSIYDKYDEKFNYQSIANVLWIENGLDDVLEFVRRLVHTFAIGNGDMHLKNWSVCYPDDRHPRLSPAYDLVSTIVYPDIMRSLPHRIAGIKDFDKIDIDSFKNFAQIAKLPEKPVLKVVRETADAIKESWTKLRSDLPIPESFKVSIEEHMKVVPFMKQ